jgi:hypothetical protein
MGTQHLVCEVQAMAKETLKHGEYNTAQRNQTAVRRLIRSHDKDNHSTKKPWISA